MSEQRVAGRALDAEIAERVLGFRVIRATEDGQPRQFYGDYPHGLYAPSPGYSTEIKQAWKVVASRALGQWSWTISLCDDGRWFAEVRVGYHTSYDKAYPVWADSAPLAICLSALAASEHPRSALVAPSTPESGSGETT